MTATPRVIGAVLGSFYPPTLGHIDLIVRGAAFCSKLYVGVGYNPLKSDYKLSLEERVQLLQKSTQNIHNISIESFSGLAVDFAEEHQVNLLIRGVRGPVDLDEEMQMAFANYSASEIETVFLPARGHSSLIRASLVRALASEGKSVANLVPTEIADEVLAAFMN